MRQGHTSYSAFQSIAAMAGEDWKLKMAQLFEPGGSSYNDCVKKRGRMAGSLKVVLNNATKFTMAAKASLAAGQGVPHTAENLKATQKWLVSTEDHFSKLRFFNEKMKGFFNAQQRVDTNQDWTRTENYCTVYEDNFLLTRENLFKIFFMLVDHVDKDRILQAVVAERRNFAFIPVPEAQLKTTQAEIHAPDTIKDVPPQEAFHGFGDEDDDYDGGDETVEEDPDATVRGAGALDRGTGDLGTKEKHPAPVGTAAPSSMINNFFTGQNPITTSTSRHPIQFPPANTQGGSYELFNGPSIFRNAMRFDQNEGSENGDSVRGDNVNAGFDPGNDHGMLGNGETKLLKMFSNSLTSTFSVKTLMPQPWDGNPNTFERFAFAWMKCDAHMSSLGFADSVKFNEILKVVTGVPKMYIDQLPPFRDSSYPMALSKLYETYSSQRMTVQNIVRKLLVIPTCQANYNSRISTHAQISSYRSALNSMSINSADILLAIELYFIENALDNDLKRQFIRYCEKRRDLEHPLGYNVTFDSVLSHLLRCITESYKVSGGGSNQMDLSNTHPKRPQNQGQGNQGQGGRRWIGNAAAAQSHGGRGRGGQPQGSQTNNPNVKPGGSSNGNKNSSGAAAAAAPVTQTQTRTAAAASQGSFSPRFQPAGQKGNGTKNGPNGAKPSLYKSGCPFCAKPNGYNAHPHRFNLGCPLIKLDVLSPDKIRDIARQQRLCHACLMPGHNMQGCQSPDYIKCSYPNCPEKHFRAFHGKPEPRKVSWGTAAAAGAAGNNNP